MKIERAGGNKKEQEQMDRREFLKSLGFLGGGALALVLASKIKQRENEKVSPEIKEEIISTPDPKEKPGIEVETPERDIKSLKEIIDFNDENDLELKPEDMEAVTEYWKEYYLGEENPDLRDSFQRMDPWIPHLEAEFEKVGIPKEYLYLAIPESEWKFKAESHAGAVGPYQFMPRTAKSYDLNLAHLEGHFPNLDERQDPLKSAEACARLLKDLYDVGQDWDLALAGYNGGYFWRYIIQARKEEQEISYAGFLSFLSAKINKIKKEVKAENPNYYIITTGETLNSIAPKLDSTVEELCQINQIDDPNQIRVGQKIITPAGQNNLEEIFWERLRGLKENLNYPPKFRAVEELIAEGVVVRKSEKIQFRTIIPSKASIQYTFKVEDQTLYSVAQKFPNISGPELLASNPQIDPNSLRGGEEIIIPSQRESLANLAIKHNLELSDLEALNPAILNSQASIPTNYEIRIPMETKIASRE